MVRQAHQQVRHGSTGSPTGSTGSPTGSTGSPTGSTGSPTGSTGSPLDAHHKTLTTGIGEGAKEGDLSDEVTKKHRHKEIQRPEIHR